MNAIESDESFLKFTDFFGLNFIFLPYKPTKAIVRKKERRTYPPALFSEPTYHLILATSFGEVTVWLPENAYDALEEGDAFRLHYRCGRFNPEGVQMRVFDIADAWVQP